MKRLVDLVKLARLDDLIRHESTGSPDELAKRLQLSRSTLFEIIAFLKEEMKAPIVYNRNRLSYAYSYTPKFYLGFEQERLGSAEMYNTFGGSDEPENNSNKFDMDDNDDSILDEDINFKP